MAHHFNFRWSLWREALCVATNITWKRKASCYRLSARQTARLRNTQKNKFIGKRLVIANLELFLFQIHGSTPSNGVKCLICTSTNSTSLRYAALKRAESYNQHYVPHAYIWKHLMLPNVCMWYIVLVIGFCSF